MTASTPSPAPNQGPSATLRRIAILMLLIAGAILAAAILRPSADAAAYRTPPLAIWVHLATVVPAVPLGALMMVATAIDSFWVRTITGGIGPIHLFSLLVLVQVPRAVRFAMTGQTDRHLRLMRGVYFGLIAAGILAMAPGRTLWTLVFG